MRASNFIGLFDAASHSRPPNVAFIHKQLVELDSILSIFSIDRGPKKLAVYRRTEGLLCPYKNLKAIEDLKVFSL